MKKSKQTPMEKLTQGYEKFIKGQETKKGSKATFDKVIKKAAKSKSRSSK